MTAGQAIGAGLRKARRAGWMVLLFYACNLVLAAAVAAPMHAVLRDHVGKSAMGEELARGFSYQWLSEFQIAHGDFLKGFSITVVYAGVLFLLLNTALSAGAFEVFTRGEGAGAGAPGAPAVGAMGWRMHAFGRGVGKFFGRFFRLAVAASVLYFLAFFLLQYVAGRGLGLLFRESAGERWHQYLDWLRWALLFLSLLVVNAVVEYTKADLVRAERDSVLGSLGHAAGFVFAHFRRVMAIYLAIGALTTLTILAYAVFARYFPQSRTLTVLLWFVVAQALLWLRWRFRLASWAATVQYFAAHRPAAAGPLPS